MMISLFLPLLSLLTGTDAAAASSKPIPIAISPSAEDKQILFSWPSQRCPDKRMLPDAPVRAFRRADGQISLIATSYVNWAMTGPSFNALKVNCQSVFSPEDAGGGQHTWIQATYTHDGRTVAALLSREISNTKRPGTCKPTPGNNCWLNDIVSARSTNMGGNYSMGPVVASLGEKLPLVNKTRLGAFTTSNIAGMNGRYYTVIFFEGLGKKGNCLARSDDPLDQAGWRGWDGRDFTLDLGSPAMAARCVPLANLNQPVRSIGWLSAQKRWVALMATSGPVNGKRAQGFFFSESPDLRSWGAPRLIVPATVFPAKLDQDPRWSYPVLIDPLSSSRNFDTIDHPDALIVYTEQLPSKGQGRPETKNLVAMKVRIGVGSR